MGYAWEHMQWSTRELDICWHTREHVLRILACLGTIVGVYDEKECCENFGHVSGLMWIFLCRWAYFTINKRICLGFVHVCLKVNVAPSHPQ